MDEKSDNSSSDDENYQFTCSASNKFAGLSKKKPTTTATAASVGATASANLRRLNNNGSSTAATKRSSTIQPTTRTRTTATTQNAFPPPAGNRGGNRRLSSTDSGNFSSTTSTNGAASASWRSTTTSSSSSNYRTPVMFTAKYDRRDSPPSCPFDIRTICVTCFTNGGTIAYQNGTYCSNRKVNHVWNNHKGWAAFDGGKAYRIHDLPESINRNRERGIPMYVRMCNPQRRQGQPQKCMFSQCHFAHNDLERRCWIWMGKHGVKPADVATNGPPNGMVEPEERRAPLQQTINYRPRRTEYRPVPSLVPRSTANVITRPPIAMPRQPPPPPPPPPQPPAVPDEVLEDELDDPSVFYCYLCGKSVDDYDSFDDHVNTEMHRERYRLVEENRVWKYRAPQSPPPLQLCERHLDGQQCNYSGSKDEHNHCKDAHSIEELDEWNERLEYMERALERKESADMVELRTKIEEARKAGKSILTPCVDYASITCDGNKAAAMTKKGDGYKWKFTMMVTGVTRLRRVILLNQDTSMYFRLSSPFVDTPNDEIQPGEIFADDGVPGFYKFELEFVGSKTAQTFTQRIAFDFQRLPIVYEEVTVFSGLDKEDVLRQASLRSSLKQIKDRWTPESSDIIWISKSRSDQRMDISNVVANLNFTVNESNYFSLLKQWLYAEEYKRQSLLDEMALKNVEITAVSYVMDNEGNEYQAPRDDVGLAVVRLKEPLSEDVDVITLLREYCTHAFISPTLTKPLLPGEKRRVYEVDVINEMRFKHQGVFSDRIHLQLGATFVNRFRLNPGSKVTVDIQFNFYPKQFRRWLDALDRLRRRQLISLIFPDLMTYFPDYASGEVMAKTKEKILAMPQMLASWKREHNDEERAVMGHVLSCALDRNTWVPPLVVFGAFGTGKTRTLASAAATLLMHKEFEHTKILICTHANTTADMYIGLLLQHTGWNVEDLRPKLWRVHNARSARSEFLDQFIRSYFDARTGRMKPEPLTLAKLRQMRVVISTFEASDKLLKDLTSGDQTEEDIDKVAFTHIFIDEAAQAMELETVMPLCLAKRSTCIVVAGDHHQIRPPIYLSEAKELSCSYLERLWYYYHHQKSSMEKTIPKSVIMKYRIPSILFNKNYRCRKEILSFISAEFYGDADCLSSCLELPGGKCSIKPLNFVVSPHDEEVGKSGSIINPGEAKDVVDQVEFLWRYWPKEWGERKIGVAVPYVSHGHVIRELLKERGIGTSTRLDVSRVIQMQGKEYSALVISTVRGPKQLIESGAGNRSRNLGFLDDARLINTAMTRAKYSVIVVGNPYVLCSLGSCREIWYRYIWRCALGGGELLPKTIKWPNVDEKIQQYQRRFVDSKKEKLAETTSDTDLLVQQLTKKTQREAVDAGKK